MIRDDGGGRSDDADREAFASMFPTAGKGAFVDRTRLESRRQAERRAAMTPRQLSRGGRVRDAQLNVRTTRHVKLLAGNLAEALGLGLAETIELAISELASRKGVNLDQ